MILDFVLQRDFLRAFADDLPFVFQNVYQSMNIIQQAFDIIYRITFLIVNVKNICYYSVVVLPRSVHYRSIKPYTSWVGAYGYKRYRISQTGCMCK